MFESSSKFPKIFVYIMTFLSILIFIGMFFSTKLVMSIYFIAILIGAIILLLDKKYGTFLTNYKLTYFLFEIVNLIAVVSIIYYEYSKHTDILNLFLVLLVAIEFILILFDIFAIKNKNLTKQMNLAIDFIKLCAMICFITYFFGVSKLYFSIFAFVFESMNLTVKMVSCLNNKKEKDKQIVENKDISVEDVIKSNADVGDGE